MKILHLSTGDIGDGASRAAHRLHVGLCRLGYESLMLVEKRESHDPTVRAFSPPMDLRSRVRRRLRWEQITRSLARYDAAMSPGAETFADDRSRHGADLMKQLSPSDVINLHLVAGFLDYGAFFTAVPRYTPVVWTLHEMNAFTGGCHYDDGCGKHTARCGACPQLGSTDQEDLSRQAWRRKHGALEGLGAGRLHIVADSHWLATEARRSSLFADFPITTVHYGLDLEVFAPRERSFARSVLGIPVEAPVVLFVAAGMHNRRKGLGLLAQALAGLAHLPNLYVLSAGSGFADLPSSIRHLHVGLVKNDRFLSLVYSAADVFVIPSLQEAFGQTALEAMACGTPVVGFAVGGIPEVVRPGVTGLLVPARDVVGLRCAIEALLRDSTTRVAMGVEGRKIALAEHSLEMQAQRYVDLYQKILSIHT